MSTRLILFFFLLMSQHVALTQTTISGIILDHKGKELPGANIMIKGSYDGTTADISGKFSFETSKEGFQILLIKMMGFKAVETVIECTGGEIEVGNLTLKEEITDMNAVTISAGALEASDENKAVVLRPLDIVTTPSAMGDITGALQTLPGTSTVGNDGRLFVRGGDASEVGIYIDGLFVGNAYGSRVANVPTRTRFNPNLFKGTFFSTGGYSAEFGQALSSALALSTKDLSVRNQGDLSIMSVGGGYSHTFSSEKQSITASANYFDLGPYQSLINQNFDFESPANGWDFEVASQKKLSKGGHLKALFRTEGGGMELWQPVPGVEGRGVRIKLNNDYTYGQANWSNFLSNDWTMFGGVSYSRNVDNILYDSLKIKNTGETLHAKTYGIKDFSDRISMKLGLEFFRQNYSEALPNENLQRNFKDNRIFAYTEWDWYLSSKLVFRTGLRAGSSDLSSQLWADPRVSFAFQISDASKVSLAAGTFNQMPVENFRVLNPNLANSEAKHLIANYFFQKEGRTFRAEAFYKGYNNLVTFDGNQMDMSNLQNEGEGYAQGLDIFFRDQSTIRNTDYWVTYSFVDSKRQFDQFETQVQPSFAPRHNFSLVIKHFITNLNSQIGFSFTANDGYTYTDPNLNGEMNSKTKSFQNLSLSWSYLPKPNLIIHLACTNVLGRENVFGYSFSQTPNEDGVYVSLPSGQVAPRFLFLGVFLTLSKDKTANQLNNL
ncbi:TonB-dependent receptor [Algoriphagus sediminis]|uniref:TonB-dependent receptor n=1 Tax=Algoriphagus sediminis TaxID=3057113 RepID=A0ABT7YC12_9BACT|nr:TonB-dependent receptor [Algoriphagus sediminis]MDN3204053.1 TonB-dependent receptor [Algoriphagus sediminis]